MSSDGTFRPTYVQNICLCGYEGEMQEGSEYCDECLFEQTMRRVMGQETCLWQRNDGRVGWSVSDRAGTPIRSHHKGWGREYEAGTVGEDGWRRTTALELGMTLGEVKGE